MASAEKQASLARAQHDIDPEKQPLLKQHNIETLQQEQSARVRGNVLKPRGYLPLCVFTLYVIFAVIKGLVLVNCGLIGNGGWDVNKHTNTSINDDWVNLPESATSELSVLGAQSGMGGGRRVALEAHIMYVVGRA